MAVLAAACALVPGAEAKSSSGGGGVLSSRLAELATPGLRSAPHDLQAEALSVPVEGAGSLVRRGNRVVAEVRFEHGAVARVDELRAAGAQVLGASRRYQMVTVAAKPTGLRALGEVPGVANAREVLAPFTAAACTGSITSEGDVQLGTAAAREDFGLDGGGVTVGILSDSFDEDSGAATDAAADIASGDLPGPADPCGHSAPVNVLEEIPAPEEASDEGRAMAQIVHDLAPGAGIAFATAFFNTGGQLLFAKNIERLAAPVAEGGAGASVIVDDVGYFEEPFYQDGPVAVAIDKVVGEGVSYLTAAGNDNLIDSEGHDISSWEAPAFRDAAACPPALKVIAATEVCLDFNPVAGPGNEDPTFGITVEEEETLTVDVQWKEPWNGVDADIDAYLLDSGGVPLKEGLNLVASTDNNVGSKGTQIPAEVFSWENPGPEQEVQLAINRCFSKTEKEAEEEKGCNPFADPSAKPRIKLIMLENGGGVTATEYPKSAGGDVVGPSIFGHAGTAAAVTVGAVHAGVSSAPEPYSSRGPVTHYFGPVTGTTPAAPIVQAIPKPDVVATDCGRTTFFVPSSEPGVFRFCGTSAAAPHAAAATALLRQANPSLTPAQLDAALGDTAKPVGAFGHNSVGAGLVDAYAAIDEIALPPRVSFSGPPAVTNDRSPSIAFSANRPVTFSCAFDGAPLRPCASPIAPEEPLTDGGHSLLVRAVDLSGKVGQGEKSFSVDTVPPRTFFLAHPRKNVRTHSRRARAFFRFGSDDETAVFICRVDGGLFHFCEPVLSRRFGAGVHTVRVKAFDAAGNVDPTAAVYRFRVRRVGG